MKLIAGLTEITSKAGSFDTAYDQVVSIAAPKLFTAKDIAKLRRDCEVFLDRIKKNPDKIQTIMKLGLSGNPQAAADIIKELKLREEDFENEDGGCILLIILIIIIILVASTKSH